MNKHEDIVDARAAVKALREKLEDAYTAEQAAAVARLLARRALDEAIERLNALERG
jgi:ribosomal protein L18